MEQNKHSDNSVIAQAQSPKPKRTARFLAKSLVPLLVIAAGVGFLKYQMDTRPEAERRKPERQARLVMVMTVNKEEGTALLHGMGTVAPSRQVALCPEITGVITSIDPAVIPGGFVKAGQVLYQVDCRDYQTIVKQRESELAKAQLEFKVETGNQTVARQEYELLSALIQEEDTELVLRKPQLQNAQQALQAAEAALQKARLDVDRCSVRAPFNAIIKSRYADLGARVSPSAPLVELTGTDEYWIEVKVFTNQLSWIEIPSDLSQKGSPVRVFDSAAWPDATYREGNVIRLLGQLEEEGRLARVLVAVPDPLHLQRNDSLPPLLIGSFVRAEIVGRPMSDVIVLPRSCIRDGDSVWVMNEKDQLEIRPITVVYSNKETVFVARGLEEGERIVTTMISAPVDGMPLRVEQSRPNPAEAAHSALPSASEASL